MIPVTVALILALFTFIGCRADQLEECLQENNSSAFIVSRGDPSYEDYNFQWNIRRLSDPKGYIVVTSSGDVRSAVHCLVKLKLKFRTKCGGHSLEKYSFGDDDSWIIDLQKLNDVEVDQETNIASVGAGIQFKMLSDKLYKMGKYGLPMGSCFSVGISGFTIGGGYGPQSRTYGLMVDRVVAMEVVTADAKILHVNDNQYSDLFWALRGGGGGNMAIVTKFDLKVFDASPKILYIRCRFTLRSFPIAFFAWQDWLQNNASSSVGSLVSYNGPGKFVDFEFIITDDYKRSRQHLKHLKKHFKYINAINVHNLTYPEYLNRITTPYMNKETTVPSYYKPTSFYVSRYLSKKQIDVFDNVLRKNKDVSFLLETHGGVINEKEKNETAFCHRDSLYVLQFGINKYTDEYPDLNTTIETGKQAEKGLYIMRDDLKFMDNGEAYINYIDEHIKHPFKAFYCSNYDLLEIQRKYDPHDVFDFPLSIKAAAAMP